MKNYHSHTEFCDGRASMAEIASSAFAAGFEEWGSSPHSPICCESSANMKADDVDAYIEEAGRLKKEYEGRMKVLTGMEVDYVSNDFGPHSAYFKNLPLDYRIGSVHFVRNQKGKPVDVDGPADNFLGYLTSEFDDDLRYVVDTYFAMELEMIELGGFDILGHLDKIGDNGSASDPELEGYPWYAEYVEKVISKAVDKGLLIEINTKKYATGNRFFPAERWWPLLKKYNAKLVLSTDAHYTDKVTAGYQEAYEKLKDAGMEKQLCSL